MNFVLRADDQNLEHKLRELKARDMRDKIAIALSEAKTDEQLKAIDDMIESYISLIGAKYK